MKKHNSILKHVLALGITSTLISCKKHDDVTPTSTATGDAIYRPSVVFDSYDNHLIDYTYDATNRVQTSKYYSYDVTKELFTSTTNTWYYADNSITKKASAIEAKTNKEYTGATIAFSLILTIQSSR
jgi:hypothetical protein